MPARHSDYKQLALKGVHKHAKLAGVMSPAPNKNSIQKFNTKNSSQHILTFYLGQRHGSFQGSKDENGKERCDDKLTGEDGYIKILDSRDFVQFCKQQGFDLHHEIDGKEIRH